jgi:phosphate transport system permease protein
MNASPTPAAPTPTVSAPPPASRQPAGTSPIGRARTLSRAAAIGTFAAGAAVGALLGWATRSGVGLAVTYGVVLGTVALYGVSRALEGRRRATDRLVTSLVYSAFALAMIPLVWLLEAVIRQGLARLDAQFFTESLFAVVNKGGGAYHAIMGTLIITGLTTLISVPIGLLTAIYLVEYGHGRLRQAINLLVDVMTGIPSIVAGLFAYALFEIFFGPGVRLGIAGAVALSVLMIPVVVRAAEEVLKLVPNELREASYALGVPKWRTILKVVVPTAVGGLGTGITLAIARVVGETAPLLVTVGITAVTNLNPFDGRMATLPVFAYYQLTRPGVPPQYATDRAWTAALLLIVLVMALNVVARLISRLFAPKTGR